MKTWIIISAIFLPFLSAVTIHAQSFHKKILYNSLFMEVSGIVEENFYNPEQISRDFPGIKEKYLKQLELIKTGTTFSGLMNAMLKELHASHTYYLTPDNIEYYQLSALFLKIPEIGSLFKNGEVKYPSVGIITQDIEGKIYIASVFPGGAAKKAGLMKGDEIMSVDGKPYEQVASMHPVFGCNVTFKIKRQANVEPLNIVMGPIMVNPKQEMMDAQKASVCLIEHSGKKIGYIHIYSYAGEEYHQELINSLVWGELKKADALIIDLRYGLGGAWPYYLNIFNTNIPVLVMNGRNGAENKVDSQWRKPAVYLVNKFTRSGKELLAFGAKKYRLATVIGEKTAGNTLGGRLFPLSNGDLVFLATQSCTIDGVNLEGVGVKPDITVPFDIRYCRGYDAQLDKAVEFLADKLTIKLRRKND